MNKFETVLLFSSDLNKSNIDKLDDFFKIQLKKLTGSIINEEDWGLRDLSYQIKKNKKAFYKFYQIEIDGNNIQEIKENLNKEEKIIRYIFIKVDQHSELPTKMVEK
tara:strand:- start:136 stop:456 length:321 start_codon:yes stop_codon:yes gene_type:complete